MPGCKTTLILEFDQQGKASGERRENSGRKNNVRKKNVHVGQSDNSMLRTSVRRRDGTAAGLRYGRRLFCENQRCFFAVRCLCQSTVQAVRAWKSSRPLRPDDVAAVCDGGARLNVSRASAYDRAAGSRNDWVDGPGDNDRRSGVVFDRRSSSWTRPLCPIVQIKTPRNRCRGREQERRPAQRLHCSSMLETASFPWFQPSRGEVARGG